MVKYHIMGKTKDETHIWYFEGRNKMTTNNRRPSQGRPSGGKASQSRTGQKRPVQRSVASRPSSSSARTSRTRNDSYEDDFYEDDFYYEEAHGTQTRSSSGRSAGASKGKRPSGKASGKTSKKAAKKKKSTVVVFVIEILLIVLLLGALAFWYTTEKVTKVGKVDLPEEDIVINPEVEKMQEEEGSVLQGYRNIALFGVDSTEGALTKNTRSDTIMIASINLDTGDCKLVSVYRDTYLNLSNDTYNKCNAAYAKGGPMQAINMLNMNLDMNITDFVTVGFGGLTDTIDALGGIYIDVKENEISHLNNYQISIVGTTKDGTHYEAPEGSYVPVTQAGYQKLNGLQATAYCRIRYVGSDFERTARQRRVLKAVADEAKKATPAQLEAIASSVFDKVYTSLDLSEIVSLLGNVSKYNIVDEGGFPNADMITTGNIGKKGSCVVPQDLESNVSWLHEFLFDETGYEPSAAVKEYSAKIAADTSSYVK